MAPSGDGVAKLYDRRAPTQDEKSANLVPDSPLSAGGAGRRRAEIYNAGLTGLIVHA
jgi:hypothetical protein